MTTTIDLDEQNFFIGLWETPGVDRGCVVRLLDADDEITEDLDMAITAVCYSSEQHDFMTIPISDFTGGIRRWDKPVS